MKLRIPIDEPHPGQWQVVNNAARFNVLECGRRFGKTKLGLFLACQSVAKGQPVAWFAPTYKYLPEVWREAERTLKPAQPKIHVQDRRIEIPATGGIWDFWSLDQPDAGRGRKYQRVVIDEAGIIRDLEAAWTEAIRPTLADLKGDAWFLGTPKGRNFFHRLFARGESGEQDWRSWRLPTTTNPYIDAQEIEAARRDMPPAAFDQEFLGIPADDGGNPFGLDAIRKCLDDTLANPEPGVSYVMGVDLAKSVDWTVCVVIDTRNGNVVAVERWQSPWNVTLERIRALASRYNQASLMVDQTGVGDPVVEQLQRMSYL